MTLNDIGRMLKLAKVPRSKVIQTTYPNPAFVVLVPMTHYMVVANVVGQLKFRTDNVAVKPISDERIGEREHMYVKVTGQTAAPGRPYDDANMPEAYYRRARMRTARTRNRDVVVECVSVVL